jgi:signal transduction histidine kinase
VNAAITAAISARKLNDTEQYKSYLAKAEDKIKQVEHPYYKASLYQNLSGIYFDAEEYVMAHRYIDSALVHLKGNEDSNMSASIFMSKGLVLQRTGNTREAIPYLEKALGYAQAKKDWFVLREANLGLSEMNFSLGNIQKAYEHHLAYVQYKDSAQRIESERIVAEMAAKYRTEKQQLELSRLEDQALADDLEKEQNKRQYIFLLIIAILVVLTLSALYLLQRRRNTILQQKEALISEQLKRLESERQIDVLDSMLKGEETERSRVAKDLHDGVGSLLSGVKLSLSSMDGNMFISADHARIFERSLHQLDDAISEMRRVAQNMMPEILIKSGLIASVNQLANSISQNGGISIHVEHHDFDQRLSPETEIIVYRLIQELLQNILKHSAATEVIIQLSEHDENINIVVEDNGKGFSPDLWEKSTGMGFSNLKNRVNYLKGSIHVNTKSGEGTSFLIEFKRKP